MFSIEKTLEEIIHFFKKFFFTFYHIMFCVPLVVENKEEREENLIKPNLYLMISLFLFLAFIKARSSAKEYFGFVNGDGLGTKILYIIPLAILLFSIIRGLGYLFLRKEGFAGTFKILCYYLLGNGLIIFTVVHTTLVQLKNLFFYPRMNLHPNQYYIIEFLITFNIVSIGLCLLFSWIVIHRNGYLRINKKFSIIPLLIPLGVLLCIYFLVFFIPMTDLAKKRPVEFIDNQGNKNFVVFKKKLNDNFYKISTEMLIRNKCETALLIKNGDAIWLQSNCESDKYKVGNPDPLMLNIEKIDSDSSGLKIIEPGNYVKVYCSAVVAKNDLNRNLHYKSPDNCNKNNVILTYSFWNGEGENVQEKIPISIILDYNE